MDWEAELGDPITGALADCGFEIVTLRITGARQIKILVDREGGVKLDDCIEAHGIVQDVIRKRGHSFNSFSIEVLSPGLDRPLSREKDFQRFAGHKVKVTLHEKLDGRRNFQGMLVGLENGEVCIRLPGDEERSFPLEAIKETRLVPSI